MSVNNKGFSLIELMVVVAIIAILATIAVPSYQGFQAKARQKEGFALLNAYYTSSQATYAELGAYPGNFVASGFSPTGQLGYRLTAVDNMTMAGVFPMYGSNDAACISTDNAVACDCGGGCAMFKTWNELTLGVAGMYGPSAPAMAMAAVADQTFTAAASGWIKTNAALADEYTIDQLKNLVMVQDGLN